MPKVVEWFKKKENRILILKLLLALCFPFVLCVCYCLREGAWIGDLHLGSAQNNDILFYYKQVEGMVEYGIPQGFFGYNESAALKGSFGVWGPFVLLPWAIWGKLFGWTMSSPFICNIVALSITFALVVWWIRPNLKQMAISAVMIALFPAFARYTMSNLAELFMFCYVLSFYGLAMSYARKENKGKLIGMFALGSFLVWLRPYMALLLLLPGFFLFLKNKWLGFFITAALGFGNVAVYFLISYFLTADYFLQMFDFYLVTSFFQHGFETGVYYLAQQVRNLFGELFGHMKQSFIDGAFMGSNYWVLFLLCILISTLIYRLCKQKEKLYSWVCVHFIFTSLCGMTVMIMLMQKINETSRHIMAFILVGMVLLGCTFEVKWKDLWKPLLVAVLCIVLYHYFPDDGKDYQTPIRIQERYEEQVAWQEINQKIQLEMDGTPSYANTLIWVFSDKVDGKPAYMSWRHMLSVPAGMGISCCMDSYLIENWDSLKSRYISTLSEGEIAQMCEESGFEKIGEAYGKVLYKRY